MRCVWYYKKPFSAGKLSVPSQAEGAGLLSSVGDTAAELFISKGIPYLAKQGFEADRNWPQNGEVSWFNPVEKKAVGSRVSSKRDKFKTKTWFGLQPAAETVNFLLKKWEYIVFIMDREQTLDIVDTPAPDMRDWPALEDFQEPEETLKWRDVQLGMYKVLELYEHGQSKFGPSVVLKLESKNGTIFFVWATPSTFYAIKKRKTTNFILNLWVKISEETGSMFYDFKFC